jgi:hypothetical protein
MIALDDIVDAGTGDLDEDPVAAYLGYDWWRHTPDAFCINYGSLAFVVHREVIYV